MIKKLIFDLDNTLIMWKDVYIDALEKTMLEYQLKEVNPKKIDDIIESLEKKYETLSKEVLLRDINTECDLNLDISFINTLFKKQTLLAEVDNKVIETLEYLSQKYELIVLSNYFKEVQEGRLKTAKIFKYFSKVYGGDEILLKPNKEAFLKAIYPNNIEECIMIGDSIECDIKGALNIGLKVIALDYKSQIPDSSEYIKIKAISDLKNIL